MIKPKFIFLFILISIFSSSVLFSQTIVLKKNIEKFGLSAYTSTIDDSDSLKISVYMQIPNSSLQYVKSDSQFIAKYEAVIAVQTKKGKQLGREIWQDSIVVNNYQLTKAVSENSTMFASYKIPPGKYKVVGSLQDRDTKKVGKNNISLDLSDYKNKRFLHKPVLIENFDGNWGFGQDIIPALGNLSFNPEEGLKFYLSGKVTKGKYQIKNQFTDKSDKVLYSETIQDTSESGIFEHIIKLPEDKIKGLTIKLKSELVQKTSSMDKTTTVILKKVGISHFVNDLDEALYQMRYILSSKELKKVKKSSTSEKEELFKKLWKDRDPTPETINNELMNEYFRRVAYANAHFASFLEGWETDMGMVYIILGPPDDIEKYMSSQYQEPYEKWHYYRIQESFTFVGDNFGYYTLLTPFFGYKR